MLICENSMTFNGANPQYHKDAKRMKKEGLKVFAKLARDARPETGGGGDGGAHDTRARTANASAPSAVDATKALCDPIDVVMLLAEPRVLGLVLERCLELLDELAQHRQLPQSGSMHASASPAMPPWR